MWCAVVVRCGPEWCGVVWWWGADQGWVSWCGVVVKCGLEDASRCLEEAVRCWMVRADVVRWLGACGTGGDGECGSEGASEVSVVVVVLRWLWCVVSAGRRGASEMCAVVVVMSTGRRGRAREVRWCWW